MLDSLSYVCAGSDGHIDVDMEQQADNFLGFFIGGRQPMVTVLSFALLLTLKHPEVLARYTVILAVTQTIDKVRPKGQDG
jgi:cytochrome P450